MSRTPDKNDVTALKFTKVQKTEKVVTQYRALQTDRKQKEGVKSPLMIIMLLKKKVKSRIEHAFMRINLWKNTDNRRKIIARYMSSILKFKIKLVQANTLNKLKNNSNKNKNRKVVFTILSNWVNAKIKSQKSLAFLLLSIFKKSSNESQSKYEISGLKDSKAITTVKKNEVNRSLDLGPKSVSASKMNISKKIQFNKSEDLPADIIKIQKQNEQLKLMELSQDVRQVLKKIQRFDRYIYAQESEKTSKDALATQIKRLQKIKNSQKQMRGQYYDNQLTITALFNHIKLISQLNKDIGDLSVLKQKYTADEARRKQQQFKANLQSKRIKSKQNNQAQIKQLIQNINQSLSKKDFDKARVDITQLLSKFQKDELVANNVTIYRALIETINNIKENDKFTDDLNKLCLNFKNVDFNQPDQSNKILKALQKDITAQINKLAKQETNEKVNNIFTSLESINNSILQHFDQRIQKERATQSKSKVPEKSDDPLKKLAQIQKQLQNAKKTIEQLNQTKLQFDSFSKTRTQFSKKVQQILAKAANKTDFKKDKEALRKDKLFINTKPYSQFFNLEDLLVQSMDQQITIQITNINNFFITLTQIFSKQKAKPEAKSKQLFTLIENYSKKNPKLIEISKGLQNLLALTIKNTESQTDERSKNQSGKKQVSQGLKRSGVKAQTQKQDPEQKIIQLTAEIQKYKQQKQRIQKQSLAVKQGAKITESAQKKIQVIINKIRQGQQWFFDIQSLRKDRALASNKIVQMILIFFDNVADVLKKQKLIPSKLQKILGLLLKIFERKNLTPDKKFLQTETFFENSIKSDPYLTDILKVLNQWTKTILIIVSEQIQERPKQQSTDVKKYTESIQNQRNKSKSLTDKVKQLEKVNRQQTLKLNSLEKQSQTKQKKQISSQKKPPLSRSQETLKNDQSSSKIQVQLKTAKERILVLQKQLSNLKKQQGKRQLSGKKETATIKVQQQLKQLQQELKTRKQRENQQKQERTKQITFRTQTQKTITTIVSVLETKNYKNLQNQANKLLKTYEKDQRFTDITNLIASLIKLLVEKQNADGVKKKQIETITEAQGKDRERIDAIVKIAKQSEADIKSGVYLANAEYWDKFLVGLDPKISGVVKDLVKILKILTSDIKAKAQKLQQITSKSSSQSSNTNGTLEIIKSIEQQINRKDYFKNDDGWTTLQTNVHSEDKIIKAIFRIVKKFSQTSRTRLSDERKLSEKSIKSYQGELQKMNNFISQYEIKLKQKQRQHQELYKSYVELQKQSGDEPKRGNSLRTSRKSARSNSSEKQSQVKSIKQTIKNYVVDEKNMLEQLSMAENDRIALVERINFLQQELNGSYRILEQLRGLNKQLQNNLADQHNSYQREYQTWRQKTVDYNKQISNLRQQYQRQFEQREYKIVQQFQVNSQQQKIALQKYSKDFAAIQVELNGQISRLREQLRLKNIEGVKNEEYDTLKRTNTRLESDYNSLKLKLSQFETRINSADQISTQLQNSLRQNGQLQTQITSLSARNRQLQQELQNLKTAQDRFKQQQRNWQQKLSLLQSQITGTKTTTISNVSNSTNDSRKILQLEQQIAKLKSDQQALIKKQIETAMKFQEQDFNKFLEIHDKQIETHFFTIIIPQKIKQVQTRLSTHRTTTTSTTVNLSSNSGVEKQLNEQIIRLKESYRVLEQQIEGKNRLAAQLESKLRITSDTQQRLNEEIRKLKNNNTQIQGKIRNYAQNQQRLKRYLVTLQISWDQASSGIVSQKTTSTYLRRQTKTQTREVVREVIKADPRQEQQINDLRSKLEEQIRLYRDLQQRSAIQQSENNRLSQSSRSMSDYRVLQDNLKRLQQNLDDVSRKYNQQVEGNRVIRNELATLKSVETNLREQIRRNQLSYQLKLTEQERNLSRSTIQAPSKSNQQFRILQSKLTELTSKYNQQLVIKRQLQSKFNQSVTNYETRIQQISGEKITQFGRLNTQINGLREKVNELTSKIADRDRQIKSMQQQFRRQTTNIQGDITRQYQDRIRNYERRITEYTSQISTIKSSQQQSLTSFNHQDCDRKYKQLEQRSVKEILDLKNKLADSSKASNDEIRLLKDVVSNQKLELTQLDLTIKNIKESKDEMQRQKEGYFNELRVLTGDRDKEIFKLRSQYEQKIMSLTVQKSSLQARVQQTSQIHTSRVDPGHSIKVLELQTQISNRNQEIRHLEQQLQRRRRDFQEQHQKFLFSQREREGLRMNCNNMETHIIRLESDLSYLNTEIQRYKTTLNEIQGRQSVLRNDIIRVRTETEMENSYHLKQQISHLKEEIIKITTTNVQQIHSIHTANFDNFDTGRIRKMIQDMEAHRGVDKYGFEANEMEMLKRINQEVTELVAANRQLQTRCVMLEAQLNNGGKFAENINFFGNLQEHMQELITFLLDRQIIPNTQSYSKFMYHSQQTLSHQDFPSYFANWLNFLKSLFILANDSKSQQLRQKAQEMIQLKQQMNQILDKHIEFVQDQSYDTLNKYKMIFSDVKILLREFMNTGNQEYIQMIWRSLQPDNQDDLLQGQQQ